MSILRRVQRDLYLGSRAAGDANALQTGGPLRLAKRVARRRLTRAIFRAIGGNR